MELNFITRHIEITDRFRNYVTETVDKIEKLADRPLELDVTVSKHHGGKGLVGGDHVELRHVLRILGMPAAAVERAIAMSHEKYCSASIMLGKTAEITTAFDVLEG